MSQFSSPILPSPLAPNSSFSDPNTGAQYYFDRPYLSKMSIDAESVWADYTGAGITVGVLDSVINYAHGDIDDNYDASCDIDLGTGGTTLVWDRSAYPDAHGTMVAGVIAAERGNGLGTVGVAHGAKVASFALDYNADNVVAQVEAGVTHGRTVDVLNNSWSYSRAFQDNLQPGTNGHEALVTAVRDGRDGLGTVVVFSAGNAAYSQSSNYHGYQNSPFTIAVGATDKDGNAAAFSSFGANLLITAAGVDIMTSEPHSGGVRMMSGTSFSAPIVSAAAAVILEANNQLGYRDVMEILALSARAEDLGTFSSVSYGWVTNAATNFNGGGMHFSDSFGFGYLNLHDAVRLAETWQSQQRFDNLLTEAVETRYSDLVLTAGQNDHIQAVIEFTEDVTIESAQLELKLPWSHTNDLEIFLSSPDGTISQLVYDFEAKGGGGSLFNFPFTTNAVFGESSKGSWTIDIHNRNPGLLHYNGSSPMSGALIGAKLTVRGNAPETDDVYFYNDEFASGFYDAIELLTRARLTDKDGGTDTINAAMVTHAIAIDLSGQAESRIGDSKLDLQANVIENAFGGDANDLLIGSAADNHLAGGRGDDTLQASSGRDRIDGGAGTDRLVFNLDSMALLSVESREGGVDLSFKLGGATATSLVSNVEAFVFSDASFDLDGILNRDAIPAEPPAPAPVTPPPAAEEAPPPPPPPVASEPTPAPEPEPEPEPEPTPTPTPAPEPTLPEAPAAPAPRYDYQALGTEGEDRLVARGLHNLLDGKGGDDLLISNKGDDDLHGDLGDDRLFCGAGDDEAYGGADADIVIGADGDDLLDGGAGQDLVDGGVDNDRLFGGDGRDKLFAGDGDDMLFGGAGNDVLFGQDGSNSMDGGTGSDTFFCGAGVDTIVFAARSDDLDRVYDFDENDRVVVRGGTAESDSLRFEEKGGGVSLFVDSNGTLTEIAHFSRVELAALEGQTTLEFA
ncbi:MAG: S8 family serine peptidase [Limimaricola soesokkakensis]|uniref:S8 family serine peptidase n=2 Tax=Limimaricola soesokkakensis TaxID=1343159 RepID=UPI00405969E1